MDGRGPSPSYAGAPAVTPAWTAQAAPALLSREEGRLEGQKPIYLDVPLVALVSVCVGFVLGWFQKKDEARA